MPRFSLASYTIRVFEAGNKDPLSLEDFASGADLLKVVSAYLAERRKSLSPADDQQRLLRVNSVATKGRTLAGVIETGEYGYESDLYDVTSGTLAYKRKTSDAGMLPFYFLFCLPTGGNEGIMVVQRFGQFGIRTMLMKDLNLYLKATYPKHTIRIWPLVPEKLIQQYADKGRVTKIRFVKFAIPSDVADAFDRGHDEEEGTTEVVVTAKRNHRIPMMGRVQEAFNRQRDPQQLVELKEMGFAYDTVKVELELNGSKKTFDLARLDKIRSNIDITDDVTIERNGHPSRSSIDAVARSLLGDLAQLIGRQDFSDAQ